MNYKHTRLTDYEIIVYSNKLWMTKEVNNGKSKMIFGPITHEEAIALGFEPIQEHIPQQNKITVEEIWGCVREQDTDPDVGRWCDEMLIPLLRSKGLLKE